MERVLLIRINSGDFTCASAKGVFCKYMGTRDFGTSPVCTLFPNEHDTYTELYEDTGWIQRCTACTLSQVI